LTVCFQISEQFVARIDGINGTETEVSKSEGLESGAGAKIDGLARLRY
jgi:hypothetical protein